MAFAAVTLLTLLSGCLEPAMQFEPVGATPGKTKAMKCSPMNCTGCCAGDVCLGGNEDEACGYDGRGCNTCPSTHRCESPGACYPVPMPQNSRPEQPTPPPDAQCYFRDGEMRCE